jgi:hypothetical protein
LSKTEQQNKKRRKKMGKSMTKEEKNVEKKMFIRKMEISDIQKVEEILKPYYIGSDGSVDFHVSSVPCSILLIINNDDDDYHICEEKHKEYKNDIIDSDKNTSLLAKSDKSNNKKNKEKQTIIGYVSIEMLPRSEEEKKQILEAKENGWLTESPPATIPTIHTIVISPKINNRLHQSSKEKSDEVYSTFLSELKNYFKTGYKTLDYSFESILKTPALAPPDDEKVMKSEIRFDEMIDIFKNQGFKIISETEDENGILRYRLRCLLG